MANGETPERIHIKKLYFLIHPGFITDPGRRNDSDEKISGKDLEEAEELLKKYERKALEMDKEEVMFIFIEPTSQEYDLDYRKKELYTHYLEKIEDILGDRAIIITGEHDIFDTAEGLELAKEFVEAKGYYFDKDTPTEAFGETGSECVIKAAQNLNEVGNFSEPTKINTALIDDNTGYPQILAARYRERFSGIVFSERK